MCIYFFNCYVIIIIVGQGIIFLEKENHYVDETKHVPWLPHGGAKNESFFFTHIHVVSHALKQWCTNKNFFGQKKNLFFLEKY